MAVLSAAGSLFREPPSLLSACKTSDGSFPLRAGGDIQIDLDRPQRLLAY